MRIHYVVSNNLSQLHDELLANCSSIRPIDEQPTIQLEGNSTNVWITLPDDLSLDTLQQIDAIVTAHTPIEQTEPDWISFRSQVGSHPAYIRLASTNQTNAFLNVQLTTLLWRVGEDPGLFVEVFQLWSLMVANVPLIESEVDQLNAIAISCNMPFYLSNNGTLEAL